MIAYRFGFDPTTRLTSAQIIVKFRAFQAEQGRVIKRMTGGKW